MNINRIVLQELGINEWELKHESEAREQFVGLMEHFVSAKYILKNMELLINSLPSDYSSDNYIISNTIESLSKQMIKRMNSIKNFIKQYSAKLDWDLDKVQDDDYCHKCGYGGGYYPEHDDVSSDGDGCGY